MGQMRTQLMRFLLCIFCRLLLFVRVGMCVCVCVCVFAADRIRSFSVRECSPLALVGDVLSDHESARGAHFHTLMRICNRGEQGGRTRVNTAREHAEAVPSSCGADRESCSGAGLSCRVPVRFSLFCLCSVCLVSTHPQ